MCKAIGNAVQRDLELRATKDAMWCPLCGKLSTSFKQLTTTLGHIARGITRTHTPSFSNNEAA